MDASSGLPRKSSAIFGNLQKSSVILGNFRKMYGNVRGTFEQVLDNIRNSSENGRKSSEYKIYVLGARVTSLELFKIHIFSPPCKDPLSIHEEFNFH